MRQYLVKVHCCGSRWLIQVPAVDRWTLVDDKKAIEATARLLIADVMGVEPDSFGIDLTAGPVVANVDEYAAGSTVMKRWQAPETAVSRRSA